ncbi:hypothetical protein [Rhodopirellula sp. MGV]|uniref:hypothetical protein n=1 Tax=Rhodopirellula sp. MGV TaxID=2023130 RepID=UPI000B9664FB|nr:hypothetical protein [Rhodopirellula sp. MGV]OYP33829.1 hypothetical protein CGZ80_17630 [Rhodopirellula sp. MGV]PNY37098.1 hypothetical protein C2E31_09675 [Rhodopirellula baltica]
MIERLCKFAAAIAFVLISSTAVQAQTTIYPGNLPPTPAQSKAPSLEDYLASRLRAASEDQRSYVHEIVRLIEQGRLDKKLVLALERRSRGKNPVFPLPVFERTLRFEAARRHINVPTIQEIVARNGATAARSIQDSRYPR